MVKRRKRKLILEKKEPAPYTGYAYYNINNSESYRLTQGTLFNSFEPCELPTHGIADGLGFGS